ncbi:ribonuclease-like [Emydura macquarii macquarii]|uniref:ribonuclease-like n=1 Tax=Emydura macquarii macquarii TaxID=1129001 RepID=UPI00352A0E1A
MAMRGSRPALLLTLVLLAASLALSSSQSCAEKNRIFQKHHVDFPPVRPPLNRYCDRLMRIRQIYGKLLNTFIHAPISKINSVCSGGGDPIPGGLRRSKANFLTTTCQYDPRTRSYTGRGVSQRIIIRCCKGLPVDYQE